MAKFNFSLGDRCFETLKAEAEARDIKTRLLALGVQPDYVDYMTGHTADTYHDIQSLDIEKLRQAYTASGLSIKPKTRLTRSRRSKRSSEPKESIPNRFLQEALAQHATTYQDPTQLQDHQIQLLSTTRRELIHQETQRLANTG